MKHRFLTYEQLSQLKTYWETGVSQAELAHLYPSHTWCALQTQAREAGAKRPTKKALLREQLIRYMSQNTGVTIAQAAGDLSCSVTRVRRLFYELHRDKTIYIAGFRRAAPVYACGPGPDMTRHAWAEQKLRANRDVREKSTVKDGPNIVFTRASEQPCTVARDPLMAAFYGPM
ncbi:hypothetical protein [Pandoraea pulmonicola]|uniref:Uncharacterized protein n=1 Tax=Pandoraea pulmonicola TaxID=93221 RepID=A0AAJ4Z842_PANPU|nr:hypothetical protein [Pandoraea pulmonicola]AJC22327.1 hypothetical protein RO07_20870 [Pandoraea pulmonicola]SUA88569.1 Uncharacterised protein [Pandoraea pulmonicola]